MTNTLLLGCRGVVEKKRKTDITLLFSMLKIWFACLKKWCNHVQYILVDKYGVYVSFSMCDVVLLNANSTCVFIELSQRADGKGECCRTSFCQVHSFVNMYAGMLILMQKQPMYMHLHKGCMSMYLQLWKSTQHTHNFLHVTDNKMSQSPQT